MGAQTPIGPQRFTHGVIMKRIFGVKQTTLPLYFFLSRRIWKYLDRCEQKPKLHSIGKRTKLLDKFRRENSGSGGLPQENFSRPRPLEC